MTKRIKKGDTVTINAASAVYTDAYAGIAGTVEDSCYGMVTVIFNTPPKNEALAQRWAAKGGREDFPRRDLRVEGR